MKRFVNQTAVITGGAQGIGYAQPNGSVFIFHIWNSQKIKTVQDLNRLH